MSERTSLTDKVEQNINNEKQTENLNNIENVQENNEPQQKSVFDIDGADKIVFRGKEYTPEEFDKAMLMQSDYTKKTQALADEKKSVAKYKTYVDNLHIDLENVRSNPELIDQFKSIYPEEFHKFVDNLNTDLDSDLDDTNQFQENQLIKSLKNQVEALEKKLNGYDDKFQNEKLDAVNAQIDSIFDRNLSKYELADEDAVLVKAQRMVLENRENPNFHMTEAAWEKLFRDDHNLREKKYSEAYKKRINEQASLGKKSMDGGPSGTAVGSPRKKMSFAEATEMMIQDLGGS